MVNIAVLGYGTVGSGVVEVLTHNKESIRIKAGKEVCVKYVLDLKDFIGSPVEKLITHDFNDILDDDEVTVVAEVMGGVEPAYTFVKKALMRGKSVVTSNKELVAKHGPELLEIAKVKNVNFLFEASVGGGIPVIRPLERSLTADKVEEISGILNGTTNFILTKMADEGLDFDTVLKEAQDLGYAERNPEADVEGHDACRKIAILSSLAFGKHVDFEDIYTEGITKITKKDMDYAKEAGYAIKLIGKSKRVGDNIFAMVSPLMLKKEHPLSSVNGVFNAIFAKGNMVGDVMFYGPGAGKLPTASAVVADIIDAVKHYETNVISHWSSEKIELTSIDEVPIAFYIHASIDKGADVMADIESIFGKVDRISLGKEQQEVAFITAIETEAVLKEKISVLREVTGISSINSTIRVEK